MKSNLSEIKVSRDEKRVCGIKSLKYAKKAYNKALRQHNKTIVRELIY